MKKCLCLAHVLDELHKFPEAGMLLGPPVSLSHDGEGGAEVVVGREEVLSEPLHCLRPVKADRGPAKTTVVVVVPEDLPVRALNLTHLMSRKLQIRREMNLHWSPCL